MPDLDTILQDFASFIEEELPPPDVGRVFSAAAMPPAMPRRWLRPVLVAAASALLVLVVVGLPMLFFGGGDSDVAGQPTTTVASTTSTTTTTTAVPGITDATKAMLAGVLSRLDATYLHLTSPPEEDLPTDRVTIGDLEDALYGVWTPIAVELIDAMETATVNLKALSDSGGLYDFEEDVDALVVAVDEWTVALRWYYDPSLNCFLLLSDEARTLIVEELWNQAEWAECMNANITAEDMEAMAQARDRVKELLDPLTSATGSGESG